MSRADGARSGVELTVVQPSARIAALVAGGLADGGWQQRLDAELGPA